MINNRSTKNVIISGGGTGGHIFPAISIARALVKNNPKTRILFVGAEGRMEMEKVPAAGFEIKGLPVSGFQRKLTTENIKVLINLMKSLRKAGKILSDFQPDVVVGTGGYASGPILYKAGKRKIPTLIQEQNSYPGITNKILAKKASKICVAYEGMNKYFPGKKILFTGNPVRDDLETNSGKKQQGLDYFRLKSEKKTLLVLGGSLGARTINKTLINSIHELKDSGIQVIWQSGKLYYDSAREVWEKYTPENIVLLDFISRMDLAYAVADLVISRSGAGTISELCLAGKPSMLVPSPNVAENHQTRNAMALVCKDAAVLIDDDKAGEKLIPEALELIDNEMALRNFSKNIKKLAVPDSANIIASEVIKLCNN